MINFHPTRILLIFSIILLGACSNDDPAPPTSGPMTEPDPRQAFVGEYLVKDTIYENGTIIDAGSYVLSIGYWSTVSDTLYLVNMSDESAAALTILSGEVITFAPQMLMDSILSGSGGFVNDSVVYQIERPNGIMERGIGSHL